jgi:hypothetical protein
MYSFIRLKADDKSWRHVLGVRKILEYQNGEMVETCSTQEIIDKFTQSFSLKISSTLTRIWEDDIKSI